MLWLTTCWHVFSNLWLKWLKTLNLPSKPTLAFQVESGLVPGHIQEQRQLSLVYLFR
jgi:hypothetical protein